MERRGWRERVERRKWCERTGRRGGGERTQVIMMMSWATYVIISSTFVFSLTEMDMELKKPCSLATLESSCAVTHLSDSSSCSGGYYCIRGVRSC